MTVSPYALGTMMFGAAGNTDHDECVRIVQVALDHGINLIDTADMYSTGESEVIVGKALQGRRDEVVLASKGHFPLEEGLNRGGNSRLHLTRAVEASLGRLGTDYLDLYQVHRPDWTTDIEETLWVLTDLVRAGKIRAFGLSTYPAHEIVEAHRVAEARGLMRPRTEQPPYNLLARGIERDVLPVTERWGMGVLTWSPLGFGFLTGRHRKGATPTSTGRVALRPAWFDPDEPAVARKLDVVEELMGVADDLGCTLPELAIAFPLAHPAVTSVILGPRTLPQLEASLAGAALELDDDVLDRIDEIVPPGTNVYDPNGAFPLPWLTERRAAAATASRSAGQRRGVSVLSLGVRHGVHGHRHRQHERQVLLRGDLDAVGVADPEPLLRDLGDLASVVLDLVLVVHDVALHLPFLIARQVHLPPLPQRGDEGLVDQGHAFALGILDGHGVPDVQHPGLDPADLVALGVLDVEGVAQS